MKSFRRNGIQMILLILFAAVVLPGNCAAQSVLETLLQKEMTEWRKDKWCQDHGGKARQVLQDRTRVDCLTSTHVIKFDVGARWAEAIGESLRYGLHARKKPGLVLIVDGKDDERYWLELNATIEYFKLPIDVWKMEKRSF